MNLNPPAGVDDLGLAQRTLPGGLPADYSAFLGNHNGGEGFVGENYIVLWKAEEIAEFNDDFDVAKSAPGLFLIGSDGGGKGFGFDTRTPDLPVVVVPFTGMALGAATQAAETFSAFMEKLEVTDTLFGK
ncbi:MAG: SMI1/KNR4 family protein [Alphaproteobacteria bacterium]